jgi:methyl-accepting chemotaxis protein
MAAMPDRRKPASLVQNRRVQLLHALLIVTYLVVYTVALSAAALGPTVVALLAEPERLEQAPEQALAAAAELFLFEERVWPIAVVLILVFGLHSLAISHRVFGPLARVRSEAPAIAAGDLRRRFRFRKNDHMLELRDALNEILEGLDERVGWTQAATESCRARLEDLHRSQFAGPAARLAAYESFAAELERLEAGLAVFQTSARDAMAARAAAGRAGAGPAGPTGANAWDDHEPGHQSARA